MTESIEHPMVANWPTEIGDTPSIDGERMLWGIVVTVMTLDVFTTAIGLGMGLHEANSIVGAAIATFGIPGLLLVKGIVLALAAAVAISIPDRVSPIVPLGLALPTTIAVTVNLAVVGMA